MAYDIKRFDKVTPITVVADNTIDNTTLPINLIGKNRAGYGEAQNQNFVYLLENFAGSTPPATALSGQLWYDIANKKLKFNDGVGPSSYRTLSRLEVSSTTPTFDSPGDLWFDSTRNLLKLWTGKNTITIGPSTIDPDTNIEVLRLRDTNDEYYNVLAAKVIKEFVYIISSVSFTLKDSDDLSDNDNSLVYSAFPNVYVGLTLARTNITGVTTSDHRFWGTAMNAERLGGSISAADSVIISATPIGFNIGNADVLELQSTGIILKETNRNNVAGAIRFNSGIFEGYTGSNWVNFGGINGLVPVTSGGTGLSNCSQGQLIYGSNSNTFSLLDAGTAGYVLTMVNGLPKWNPLPSGVSHPSPGIAVSNGTTWNPSITIPNSTTLYLRGDGTWQSPGMVYPGAGIAVSNGTTWNSSITIPNSTTVYLRGDGQWGTPSSGGGTGISLVAAASETRLYPAFVSETAAGTASNFKIEWSATRHTYYDASIDRLRLGILTSAPSDPTTIADFSIRGGNCGINLGDDIDLVGSNVNARATASSIPNGKLNCGQLRVHTSTSISDASIVGYNTYASTAINFGNDLDLKGSSGTVNIRDSTAANAVPDGLLICGQLWITAGVTTSVSLNETTGGLWVNGYVTQYPSVAITVDGFYSAQGGLIQQAVDPINKPTTDIYNIGILVNNWVRSIQGGFVSANGLWNASDKRLKTDINPLTEGIKFIDNCTPVSFNWIKSNKFDIGYIAQDLLKSGYEYLILPVDDDTVDEYIDEDGFKSPAGVSLNVNYEKIVPLLANAIKETRDEYKNEIMALKQEIKELRQLVEMLISKF